MDGVLAGTLFGLGLFGGFLSGLLGIGGGIIMVPLLLYVPPLAGAGALTMKVVAGLTTVQSFFGAVSGAFAHKRYNRISLPLALYLGGSMGVGSFAGSYVSQWLSSETLLFVFACMAVVAAVMMLLPKREDDAEQDPATVPFHRSLTIVVGLGIGILTGIVGQGGAFLFIPVMLYMLGIPTRIAIGTALVVGIVSSIAVLLGRLGSAQIPLMMSMVLVTGVLIGAQIGGIFSQRTPREMLRKVLSVLIAITALKIWHGLLTV
jgi:hypothetical protein